MTKGQALDAASKISGNAIIKNGVRALVAAIYNDMDRKYKRFNVAEYSLVIQTEDNRIHTHIQPEATPEKTFSILVER